MSQIIQKKYGFSSEIETCRQVCFVNSQEVGQSQNRLISELKTLKMEQYGISLICDVDSTIDHYAYIDDGLYSGSRARKDIKELACCLKPGDTLDVFYLVVCMSGFSYTNKEIKKLKDEYKIDISFYSKNRIENEKNEDLENNKDGTETVHWSNQYMCLWPCKDICSNNEIEKYGEYLKTLSDKCEKHPYRRSHWVNDRGVFSSAERRKLIEYEFLQKGIQITTSYSEPKGMYPLGYNLWPSFGFGVLLATDLNVPNNAPLVLWADANWYPLLPRRKNNQNVDIIDDSFDFDEFDESEGSFSSDQYNMCPDCGKIFGLDEDGGNGFCIDCAWRH